ncbi:MAG TPA: hypothetical protein VGU66_18575 [Candidatus Elarobacter sp.]|nr:hypothetical protein [Candidatus Elarobacter sp.]
MSSQRFSFFDALYGEVELPAALGDLARMPVVQRLRDIRLSNIDSLSMPGISNISRYEHALGSAFLASSIGRGSQLTDNDLIMLGATALLHDAAITGFGHLVEEALQYFDTGFDHEKKLAVLLSSSDKAHLGGVNFQIFQGRQSGIQPWAQRVFGSSSPACIAEIIDGLRGHGRWGPYISSDLDLDNLDNLVRIAYHMGLAVDREMPVRIARGITPDSASGTPVFADATIAYIGDWVQLRHAVYTKLMLSKVDFVGKSMLLYAVTTAYSNGDLGIREQAWTLTDRDLINHLLSSPDPEVSRTVQAWLLSELWPLADLFWFGGEPPSFPMVKAFCVFASAELDRPCFAYRIRDKRVRRISIRVASGGVVELGVNPDRWLLGVVSRKREPFSRREIDRLREVASEFFEATFIGLADAPQLEVTPLFG